LLAGLFHEFEDKRVICEVAPINVLLHGADAGSSGFDGAEDGVVGALLGD
jgi:hypothetical protein